MLLSRLLSRYATIPDRHRNDRVGALWRAWQHVFTSQIEGAYYEMGVYRGDTFRESHRLWRDAWEFQQAEARSAEAWRRERAEMYAGVVHGLYAFDTFTGLPDRPTGGAIMAAGAFACSLEEFRQLNHAAGIIENEQVRYIEGLFADQNIDVLQAAAIVNLDCDLYESAVDALELLAPKIQQGTVLLCDDWNIFAASNHTGERRALREFIAAHDVDAEPWFPYAAAGQAFLLHARPVTAPPQP